MKLCSIHYSNFVNIRAKFVKMHVIHTQLYVPSNGRDIKVKEKRNALYYLTKLEEIMAGATYSVHMQHCFDIYSIKYYPV